MQVGVKAIIVDMFSRKSYSRSMKATISQKGQVTIPKICREKLGLRPGTVLDFEAIEGKLVGRKIQSEDVFKKWRGRGRIPGKIGVDEYLSRVRE